MPMTTTTENGHILIRKDKLSLNTIMLTILNHLPFSNGDVCWVNQDMIKGRTKFITQ